jgi:hypothetical protein
MASNENGEWELVAAQVARETDMEKAERAGNRV